MSKLNINQSSLFKLMYIQNLFPTNIVLSCLIVQDGKTCWRNVINNHCCHIIKKLKAWSRQNFLLEGDGAIKLQQWKA